MEEVSIWIISGMLALMFPLLTYAPLKLIAKIFFKPLTESYVFLLALLSIIALGEGVARLYLIFTLPDFMIPTFQLTPENVVNLGFFLVIFCVILWYLYGFIQTLYYMIHMSTHTHALPRKVYINMLFVTTGVQVVAFATTIYAYLYRANPHLLIPVVFGVILYFSVLMRFVTTLRVEEESELVSYLTKVKHLSYWEASVIFTLVVCAYVYFRMSHGAIASIAITYSSYYLLTLLLGVLQFTQLQFTRRQ